MTERTRDPAARRILVISYHFPPDGSVGGLRWAGISKYLARLGWEVHVITAAPQEAAGAVPGVHVTYCPQRRTLNDAYNGFAQRLRTVRSRETNAAREPSAPAAGGPGVRPRAASPLTWLRSEFSIALALPDYGRGWMLRAASAARRLLRERAFEVVVTSGPPHSAHLAGTLACLGRPEPHWVDMRDPWVWMVKQTMAVNAWRSDLMETLIPRLERLVFRNAQRIVANTAEFADMLNQSYPNYPVSFVPNGIDLERLPPRSQEKFEGLSLAYAGSLYFGRDLSSVVAAIGRLFSRHPEARDAIRLRIAGTMDVTHESRFWREVHEARVEHAVEVLGRLSGGEALDLINRSHLALVLAQGQPMQVPAKIYECVALGVPTLVITEATSAAAREATRMGADVCEPADVDQASTVIERLWRNPCPLDSSPTAIGYARIAAQMDALIRNGRPAPVGACREATT